MRQIDYFYVIVSDQPGEGARVLATFLRAGISLLGFSGFRRGRDEAQLDFVPEDATAFVKAAKAAKIALSGRTRAFLIQKTDGPELIADILKQLAQSEIDITSAQIFGGGVGRYSGVVWVKPADVSRAVKALAHIGQNHELTPSGNASVEAVMCPVG
jgi:hypothetical protein